MSLPTFNWTRTPRAKALLAQIAANPPQRVMRNKVYALTREDWPEYVGPAVDELDAIRDEYGERALRRDQALGTSIYIAAWSSVGTVHQVIERMLVGGSLQRAADLESVPVLEAAE